MLMKISHTGHCKQCIFLGGEGNRGDRKSPLNKFKLLSRSWEVCSYGCASFYNIIIVGDGGGWGEEVKGWGA